MANKDKKEDDFKYIVRMASIDIDGNKKIPIGISKIRGIGARTGLILCNLLNLDPDKKVGYLTDEEVKILSKSLDSLGKKDLPAWLLNRRKDYSTGKNLHVTGSDLVISLRNDLNRLRKIRSYRGIRHEQGLPVRGQRTRTSFRKGASVGVTHKKIIQSQKESKK
jgi:small subunit ribosomal protein S13|tara:strand:- start:2512 stop:3006 length:495 start_codon:yes stop_codon:yes gene_type:complete